MKYLRKFRGQTAVVQLDDVTFVGTLDVAARDRIELVDAVAGVQEKTKADGRIIIPRAEVRLVQVPR